MTHNLLSRHLINAILANATYSYVFDVTTGIISDDIIGTNGKNYSKMLGLNPPYNFDELTKINAERMVDFKFAFGDNQIGIITRDLLIETYNNGSPKLEAVAYSANHNCHFKLSYYMWEDPEDSHIKALALCENLENTTQDQRYKQLEELKSESIKSKALLSKAHSRLDEQLKLIKLASRNYGDLFIVDITRQVSTSFKINNHVLEESKRITRPYGPTWKWYIEKYVIPEDRDYIRKSTQLENVISKLESKDELVFLYHRYVDDQTTLSRIKFSYLDKDSPTHILVEINSIDRISLDDEVDIYLNQEIRKHDELSKNIKNEFLFQVTHDVRTPMNAILGYLELLKTSLNNHDQSLNYISKIQDSSEYMLSLIDDILELSMLESSDYTLNESPCNAYVISDKLYSIFEEQMNRKNINYSVNINVQHDTVLIDEAKLLNLMLKVVDNSYKFTPEGGSISVSLDEIPSDRCGYVIYRTTIEDNGIGMSDEFLSHIFDIFSKERTSTESGILGTGLGLPIVKKLINLMQGTIDITSNVGQGTTVTIMLSHRILAKGDKNHGNNLGEVNHLSESVNNLNGLRVLLAEDNDLNAEIAIEILKNAGATVSHASDGEICLEMIKNAEPGYYDLVLMDVQMPNMDGYGATYNIRSLPDHAKADIPIIAISANAFDEDRKNSIKAGMNAHIGKPIQVETLKNTIVQVISANG